MKSDGLPRQSQDNERRFRLSQSAPPLSVDSFIGCLTCRFSSERWMRKSIRIRKRATIEKHPNDRSCRKPPPVSQLSLRLSQACLGKVITASTKWHRKKAASFSYLQDVGVGLLAVLSENGLFEPSIYKNDHFTETGSGQTQGKHSKKTVFSPSPSPAA